MNSADSVFKWRLYNLISGIISYFALESHQLEEAYILLSSFRGAIVFALILVDINSCKYFNMKASNEIGMSTTLCLAFPNFEGHSYSFFHWALLRQHIPGFHPFCILRRPKKFSLGNYVKKETGIIII